MPEKEQIKPVTCRRKEIKRAREGRVRWLMSIIPTIWEAKVDGSNSQSGVEDQLGQDRETRSQLKIQKISRSWWRSPVIPATRGAEAEKSLEPGGRDCSKLRWRHCTSAWATEQDSASKKQSKHTQKILQK